MSRHTTTASARTASARELADDPSLETADGHARALP